MAGTSSKKFTPKELVWVKLPSYPWWPAKVVQGEHNPPKTITGSKLAVASVEFLNEQYYEIIWDVKRIEKFTCSNYSDFVTKGLHLKDQKRRELFQSAINIAESEIRKLESNTTENNMATFSEHLHLVDDETPRHKTELSSEFRGSDANLSNDSQSVLELENTVCNKKSVNEVTAVRKRDSLHSEGHKSCKKTKLEKTQCNSAEKNTSSTFSLLSQDLPVTPKTLKGLVKTKRRTESAKLKKRCKNTPKDSITGNKQMKNTVYDKPTYSPVMQTPSKHVLPVLNDSWNFDLPTPSSAENVGEDESSKESTYEYDSKSCLFDPNVSKDSCDSSDSDVELPDGLSPLCGEPPISEKDVILLRWRSTPFWPAYVSKVYIKKKRIVKVSAVFIYPAIKPWITQKLTVNYSSKTIVPYSSKEKERLIRVGHFGNEDQANNFLESCEIAENYLDKKALGRWKGSFPGTQDFTDNDDDDDDDDDEDDWIKECDPDCVSISSSSCSSVDVENETISKKDLARLQRRKEKCVKLVQYILSKEMKEYLFNIYKEKKKSDRHKKYKSGTIKEKASLKNAGFGPITNEEQQEEVIDKLMEWHKEVTDLQDGQLQDVNYILDVWIPEAVIYGLMNVTKYSRSRATRRFEIGVKLTKSELKELHNHMISSAKDISPEEWDRHLKQRQRQHPEMQLPFYKPRKLLKLNHS